MALIFLDLIEDAIYFNETNFLYVRYLLHLDHNTKKIKIIPAYLVFHQFI
jgi:hypothetical protein